MKWDNVWAFCSMIIMFRIDRVPQMNISNMIIIFRIGRVIQMIVWSMIIMYGVERVAQMYVSKMIIMFRIGRVPLLTIWNGIIMLGNFAVWFSYLGYLTNTSMVYFIVYSIFCWVVITPCQRCDHTSLWSLVLLNHKIIDHNDIFGSNSLIICPIFKLFFSNFQEKKLYNRDLDISRSPAIWTPKITRYPSSTVLPNREIVKFLKKWNFL